MLYVKSVGNENYADSDEASAEISFGGGNKEYSVIYTVSSKTAVTVSGTAPDGASAVYAQTYNTTSQITANNNATLKLSGFSGKKIIGVTLSMKSNSSKGAGTFSMKAGTTTLAEISSATTFNNWFDNKSYTTSYKDVNVTLTNNNYVIGEGEDVVITIAATVNSLYIQSYEITYK